MADKWQGCFGIKKGKVPTKEVWTINAKSYESAIRSIKKSALSNYRDNHKESTLFYNGHAVGWAFRTMEKSSTWTRTMQNIGVLSKPRRR